MSIPEIRLPKPIAGVAIDGSSHSPTSGRGGDGAQRVDDQLAQRMKVELACLENAKTALHTAVRKLQEIQEQSIKIAEEQLLDLAIEIAEKVVMQEIQEGRHRIEPVVREAIKNIPVGTELTIRLNPADLERSELSEQFGVQSEMGKVLFLPDDDIPSGGCVVETAEGHVRSSASEHLREIAETLKTVE